ncbi:hypothetical protein GTA08_BOTSDO08667 [Botryosphaeria dothidea]|uniref:5'-deoxynucleotidase n=1 Tax=Botryosphaeria dothidea TaxID=55169 RepID=A0A8H4MZ87_9PEZI|nr:hypothetical protein GTA08_BOTSDO08667 [Botryosphaeria dothidea]
MAPHAPETNDSPKPTSGIISENDVPTTKWSPESVLAELPSSFVPDTDSPLPFFHLLERLKTTKREGWRRFGITHGESISDHMYRMSILTMLAPPSLSSRVNIPHCTKMALIHDMAESLVGDITPVDPISKEEKSRRESETMDYLCNRLLGKFGGGLTGSEIRKVWQEYEDNQTLEAKYVHDIDKMELLLQMMEYERSQEGKLDVGEFTWVATKIVLPEIKEWADQVFEERRQFWKKVGKEPSWGGDRKNVA